MAEAGTTRGARGRPPPWRDVRVLRVVAQLAFLAAVVGLGAYLVRNLTSNLRAQGIRTDFGFLDEPAGFRIADSPFRSDESIQRAILVGVKNTAAVSFVGIALATVLGVLAGVARLSRNWLVRRGAALYVETIRNVPPLVVIIFFYTAVILRLPPIGEAVEWLDFVVLSNSGLVVPSLRTKAEAAGFWPVVGLAAAAAVAVAVWRTRRFDATGEPHHRVAWGGAVFVAIVLGSYFALGRPIDASLPERGEFRVTGGLRLGPEYAALLIALVAYTATHIAEIVRGAILAVPRGQSDAAHAVGLSEFQRMRFVVLPQALRVAVPPIANQYLNLTKNSSLAVAIGFPEVTRVVRTVIGQGNPAPQAIAVLMLIYLAFSLGISLVTNLVNRRLLAHGR